MSLQHKDQKKKNTGKRKENYLAYMKSKTKTKKKRLCQEAGVHIWLTYIKSECDSHMSRATDRALNEPSSSGYLNTRY